jgi:DNA replication protein DnaC
LAVALALKACQAGLSIYFTTMPDLILKLKKDHEAGRPGKGRSYYKSSLVIVDQGGSVFTTESRIEKCRILANIHQGFNALANVYGSEKAITRRSRGAAFALP